MVLGSIFGEAAAPYRPDEEDEEEKLDPLKALQNAGAVPVPAPAPPPPPSPGMPTGSWAGQYLGQAMGPMSPPDETGNWGGQYIGQGLGPMSPPSPPVGGINPNQGGFRDPVYNPANVEPGPNADMGIFTPFHPINEAIQPFVQPAADFAGDVGRFAGPFVMPQYELLRDELGLGTPSAGDIGEFSGRTAVPQSVEEAFINSLGGGGITGYDDVIRGAIGVRGAATDLFRAGMPEPSLYPGLGAGVPPINPLGGEQAFGPGSRGGGGFVPPPTQPEDLMETMARSIEARGGTPPPIDPLAPNFPERYPSIPEGTMGSEFPGATNVVEAARGGRAPSQEQVDALIRAGVSPESAAARVRDVPIDPDSPAARMGAPLFADPQFMPPPAGVDETAQQMRDAFANARRQEDILTGGGTPASTLPSATPEPPPVSVPATDLQRVPELNPPGTGQQAIERAIADDPNMSEAQKAFLRSPSGQASAAQLDGALTGAKPDPNVTAEAVRATADEMGVGDDVVTRVSDYMRRSQEGLYNVYAQPEGMSRVTAAVEAVAHRAEGTFSGNQPDTFINALMNERTYMTDALRRAGASDEQVAKAVDDHLNGMVSRHYPDNPAKREGAFRELAGLEARSQTLAKDFKMWTTVNDALKQTVASVGDFAVLGTNMLVEMAQAGPYMALGTLNRAANNIATMLHHPTLLDYQRVTGLPNLIAKEAHGLPFNYQGEGFYKKGSPTIFGLAPKINPAAPIDKHVIQRVANANNKLQFDMIQGWAKNSISDGLLTQEYVRKFVQGLVTSKGNVRAANDFAMEYVSRPDVLRDISRFTRNATSSTAKAQAPGRALAEDLLPFSAAYTRAQFARIGDIAKIAAPGANETQRVLAASAIMSTVAFTTGLYVYVNDKLGTTPPELNPLQTGAKDGRPGFGKIILPGGQVVSLVPQSTVRNAVINATKAIEDGRPEDVKGILLQTGLSRATPWLSDAARGLGYGYDTKGNFYSPFKDGGKKMPVDERLKASAPVPFSAAGPLFNGQPVFSLETGLDVGGLNSYNERASSTAYRERNEAAQIRSQALVNGDLLRAAFPDDPKVAAALQGKIWNDIEYEEKQAILRTLPPEQRKQIEEADAVSAQANKEQPTAIGNAIDIRNRTDQNIEKMYQEIKDKAVPLQEALFSGSADPKLVADAVKDLKDYKNERLSQELWAGSTTYTGLPWKDSKGMERLPNQLEQAMAEYKNLGALTKPTPDGKFNYDELARLQSSYMLSLAKDDPETAARLSFINKERARQSEENKPEVVKLYDFVSKITQDYWDQPYGTKTQYLREHPDIDAWLNLVGWMPGLRSPEAAVELYRLAPERKPVFAK